MSIIVCLTATATVGISAFHAADVQNDEIKPVTVAYLQNLSHVKIFLEGTVGTVVIDVE